MNKAPTPTFVRSYRAGLHGDTGDSHCALVLAAPGRDPADITIPVLAGSEGSGDDGGGDAIVNGGSGGSSSSSSSSSANNNSSSQPPATGTTGLNATPDDDGPTAQGSNLSPTWEGIKAGAASLLQNTVVGTYQIFTGEIGAALGERAYLKSQQRGIAEPSVPLILGLVGEDLIGASAVEGIVGYDLATGEELPGSLLDGGERTQRLATGSAAFFSAAASGTMAVASIKPLGVRMYPSTPAPLEVQASGYGAAAERGPVNVPPASERTPLPVAAREPAPVVGGTQGALAEAESVGAQAEIVAPKAGENVNLSSPQRTAHILEGDATGGGHLWPGQPGKTPFPQSWTGERIMHEVSDIATDPAQTWFQQTGKPGSLYTKAGDPVRFVGIGERGGVRIKVVIEPAGEGIITAHPVP